MRVNVYAEEITNRVELISKQTADGEFVGIRFYLELPVTDMTATNFGLDPIQHRGPFIHRPGDDDSSAVTFWGKHALIPILEKAVAMLKDYYNQAEQPKQDLASYFENLANHTEHDSIMHEITSHSDAK